MPLEVPVFRSSIVSLVMCAMLRAQERSAPEWDTTRARGATREVDFETSEGTWMALDLSPDGRLVAFDLLGHIYRVPASGGAAECLTGDSGGFRVSSPFWTPDGSYLIVQRKSTMPDQSDFNRSLVMYHKEGGGGIELVPSDKAPGWHTLSRDGEHLYFDSAVCPPLPFGHTDPTLGCFQIRRMNLRTRKIENVTDGKAQQQDRGTSGGAMAPTVSPDGRHLAFARRLPDGTTSYKGHVFGPRTALWLRDLQSGAERFLMDPIELDLAEEISRQMPVLTGMVWSSDGRSIVLSQGGKLRRLDVETGAVQTIPFTARVQRTISEMAWSPLAISDGPFQPKMIRWTTASPDGKRLLFQAVGKLWIQDLPGGTPRRLTPASFTAGEFSPSWSPDGAAIAFASWDDSEHGRLWIIPGAGGTPSPITTDPGEYLNPMWSPDGKSLAYSRGSGATLRGRGWARNEWYDVVVQRVEVGEPRAIDRLAFLESPGPRA
jgi:Tol biopolymer transport system component